MDRDEHGGGSAGDDFEGDDEALLASIDESTLRGLCEQYSLPTNGTKAEMLRRLRDFANDRARIETERRRGRAARVEDSLEGKARHTILDESDDAFHASGGGASDASGDDDDEMGGYFYYEAPETPEERERREKERREKLRQRRDRGVGGASSPSRVTAPPIPENVRVNEKGERVATVFSTTDRNDLTGVTASSPLSDMSLDNAEYQRKSVNVESRPEETLMGGPFGDTSGSRRRKVDSTRIEEAKESLRKLVRNLLATTGAPAFQDDYDDDDADDGVTSSSNPFASPYGFTGFDPSRIPPDVLSESSSTLRVDGGRPLKEVLSEYELQAIGHDGFDADDRSKGGGHYREVEKVGSFLDGYRRSEERRVARETAAMMLDRLVREGVRGLDSLLAGMTREGNNAGGTSTLARRCSTLSSPRP